MTELSSEILRDWQVRKMKEQKTRFIAFLQSRLPELRVEEGGLPLTLTRQGLADAVRYVNDFYFEGCMRERNRYMVEHSSFCVACFDGSLKSGAGQTYRLAQKAGLKIYNCWE